MKRICKRRKELPMNAVEVKKKPSLKKILLAVVGIIVALLVVAFAVIYGVWHNEISTVTSIEMLRDRNDEHLDGAVYSMHVKGGFYLDDFIAQGGASNDNELIQFITDNITRGVVDIQMTAPEIGCSAFTSVTRRATVCSPATTTSPRPTRWWSLRNRTRAATLPSPRWTCSSWASTWTRTWKA